MKATLRHIYLGRTANMSWRMCVVFKQIQSNPIQSLINTRFVWYLEKYGILDKRQCGFRKHRSTTDYLVSLERYVHDAFAWKQQAVGLFFDLEKAYETTWQYGIFCDLHRIGLRGRLPVFVPGYLRERRIRVRMGNTLSDEFYPEEGVPTGGVLAVTCFGLKINELPSLTAMIWWSVFVGAHLTL